MKHQEAMGSENMKSIVDMVSEIFEETKNQKSYKFDNNLINLENPKALSYSNPISKYL